jgi:hypothetical protein
MSAVTWVCSALLAAGADPILPFDTSHSRPSSSADNCIHPQSLLCFYWMRTPLRTLSSRATLLHEMNLINTFSLSALLFYSSCTATNTTTSSQ